MRWILAVLLAIPCPARSADGEYALVIRDHRFEPALLQIPAGRKVRLTIDNQDPTAEEFESHALNREKVVPGRSRVPLFVGPLAPGRYPFFGEFNQETAQGAIVAQ